MYFVNITSIVICAVGQQQSILASANVFHRINLVWGGVQREWKRVPEILSTHEVLFKCIFCDFEYWLLHKAYFYIAINVCIPQISHWIVLYIVSYISLNTHRIENLCKQKPLTVKRSTFFVIYQFFGTLSHFWEHLSSSVWARPICESGVKL
jgi:hypothetical protein